MKQTQGNIEMIQQLAADSNPAERQRQRETTNASAFDVHSCLAELRQLVEEGKVSQQVYEGLANLQATHHAQLRAVTGAQAAVGEVHSPMPHESTAQQRHHLQPAERDLSSLAHGFREGSVTALHTVNRATTSTAEGAATDFVESVGPGFLRAVTTAENLSGTNSGGGSSVQTESSKNSSGSVQTQQLRILI